MPSKHHLVHRAISRTIYRKWNRRLADGPSLAVLLSAFLAALIFTGACSSGDNPANRDTSPNIPELDVVASCAVKDTGLCRNYVSLAEGTSVSDLEEICGEENTLKSNEPCSTENVYAQCEVSLDGGVVVSYYALPFLDSDAVASCEGQKGTYTRF